MKEEKECENANKNPGCPYIARIQTMETDIGQIKVDMGKTKTDVGWLKKGYWIQTAMGIGTFLAVLSLIVKVIGGI